MAIRPCLIYDWISKPPRCGGWFSFPSNHCINISCLAGFLVLHCQQLCSKRIFKSVLFVSILTILSVAISRVFFAQHRPTEAIMGIILGLFVSYIVFLIFHGIEDLPILTKNTVKQEQSQQNSVNREHLET